MVVVVVWQCIASVVRTSVGGIRLPSLRGLTPCSILEFWPQVESGHSLVMAETKMWYLPVAGS